MSEGQILAAVDELLARAPTEPPPPPRPKRWRVVRAPRVLLCRLPDVLETVGVR